MSINETKCPVAESQESCEEEEMSLHSLQVSFPKNLTAIMELISILTAGHFPLL